ncbi:MAG: 3-deoxy-D-manno-octulosonate 8-phosphate phosphatase [Flavobacteriales bacterium]|nr:3-deoxy-D-manno-octulosonate 8-phosphate phosphatase [Flavobacteriales bacterium]|tara:strand:- start:2273 stop:2806 length:534 start_codon:yes stop_codon:yes gene_type:complete
MSKYPENLTEITTFILDIDGVLTDGTVILEPTGDQTRTMNIKDGYALQLAVKRGYKVAIISGGKNEIVRKRFTGLGIHDVYMGASDKWDVFDELKLTYNLSNDEIAYMGDDIPDYEIMSKIGLPACPNDAATEIKSISQYISPINGGKGCVRDLIEKVLRAQDKWFNPNVNDEAKVW